MRTLFRRMFALFTGLSLIVSGATVSLAASNATKILPDGDIFIELDISKLKIDDALREKLNLPALLASTPDSDVASDEAVSTLLTAILKRARMSVVVQFEQFPTPKGLYMALPASSDEWQQFTTLFAGDAETYTKKTHAGHDYYVADVGVFKGAVTYLDGYITASESEDMIVELFDGYASGRVLSASKLFGPVADHFLSDYFFAMYGKTSVFQEALESLENRVCDENDEEGIWGDGESTQANCAKKPNSFSALTAIGISASSFDQGIALRLNAVVDTASEFAKQLLGTPISFSLMPYALDKRPILYAETSGFRNTIKNLEETTPDFADVRDEIMKETGVDFDRDIVGMLGDTVSGAVDRHANSLLPYFTLMSDSRANKANASVTLTKLHEKIKASLTEAAAKDDNKMKVSFTEETVAGTHFSVTVDGASEDAFRDNPEAKKMFPLTVSYGITGDGILYISTNPDARTKVGTGLDLSASGGDITAGTYSGATFLNFDQLSAQVVDAVDVIYNDLSGTEKQYFARDELMDFITKLTKPWHRITSVSDSDGDQSRATVRFYFDSDVYTEAYWNSVSEAASTMETAFDRYQVVREPMEDISEDAWYGDDVLDLRMNNVVKGYDDGTFRPDKPVTRAEFVTMIVRMTGEDANNEVSESSFTDVSPNDWYAPYLRYAKTNDIVKGMPDGSFHPNNPISRAEAVQILSNLALGMEQEHFANRQDHRSYDEGFKDVQDNAWYAEGVRTAYIYGLVDGTEEGRFEPTRLLNRAEAARLIHNVLKKLQEPVDEPVNMGE